jgi:hypothetical protein
MSGGKCWYSNNCSHFLKHAVPLGVPTCIKLMPNGRYEHAGSVQSDNRPRLRQ